jgi:hypothetical protein
MHRSYFLPRIDEALKFLEDIVVSQQQPPTDFHESSPDPPLVDEVVDPIPSSVNPILLLENEVNTAQFVLVTSDSSGKGGISPFSTEPPTSIEVISFDLNRITNPCLDFYIPFQIIV